jgi:hypothetical protein
MQLNDTTNLNGVLQDIYFNGKITVNTFPANDLLRIVNKYYKIAQSYLRGVSEDFFGEIWTLDLQTNTGGTYPNEYILTNTSYEKIKAIYASYSPQNVAAPLWPSEFTQMALITQDQISQPGYAFNTSNPYAIIYDSQSFFIEPLPTVTVTGGLKVFTIELQADLANATDKPNIFSDYQDVITWGSLIDIAIRKGDDKLFKIASAMFKKRGDELKEYAGGHVPVMAGAIVEGQDAQGGWSYPFGYNQMS